MDAFRDYSKFLIFYRFLINVKFRVKTQNSAYKYKHYCNNSLWKRWIRLISGYSAVFYISLPFPSTFFRASHLISSRRLLISFWISLWPSRRRNPCLCNRQIFLSYRIHILLSRSESRPSFLCSNAHTSRFGLFSEATRRRRLFVSFQFGRSFASKSSNFYE